MIGMGTRHSRSARRNPLLGDLEALIPPEALKAIVDGHSEDTERSRVLEIAPALKTPFWNSGMVARRTWRLMMP
jgi:hypothetical protein